MHRTGADLTFVRGYNEALVIAVARTMPTFERTAIADATGLTPQAVTKVLARLIADEMVTAAGQRRAAIGKPAIVYRLEAASRYAIGAHVARRTLRLVLTDLLGAVRHSALRPLPADFTPDQLLTELRAGVAETVRACPAAAGRLVGLGIGMVGPLDHAQGIVRDAHRLRHWHDVPLRELAETALELPVHLDKDVTAGVAAEAWRRGPEFRDAALIMVESGLGAGLWLAGAAYRGAHTNAGEYGHSVVQLDGPACVCGRRGCLEAVHDRAAADGDVEMAARILGVGVVNLLQTVDVAHIVLAGADLLRHGEVYRAAAELAVQTQVPRADWLPVDVSLSALGADAIAAGAAMQVLDTHYGVHLPATQ